MSKSLFVILSILFFGMSAAADGLTVDEFLQVTGFQVGDYGALENTDICNCEEFIVTDQYGTLEFTSPPGCFSVYNIGQKKVVRNEGRCSYETTSRLAGKLLTFIETKTCGAATESDQTGQDNTVLTITVTFVEDGFDYEIQRKVGEESRAPIRCQMRSKNSGPVGGGNPSLDEPTLPEEE